MRSFNRVKDFYDRRDAEQAKPGQKPDENKPHLIFVERALLPKMPVCIIQSTRYQTGRDHIITISIHDVDDLKKENFDMSCACLAICHPKSREMTKGFKEHEKIVPLPPYFDFAIDDQKDNAFITFNGICRVPIIAPSEIPMKSPCRSSCLFAIEVPHLISMIESLSMAGFIFSFGEKDLPNAK